MDYLLSGENWEWLWTGNNFLFLLEGLAVNLQIALIAIIFSLIFGLGLALLRISRNPVVSFLAGVWVDIWRNLPLALLILFLALAMPGWARDAYGAVIPDFFPEALQYELVLGALLALVLYNSAVLCEIMRSGIQSLDRGQREAAASLGLTYFQQMRFVILPQGLRRMVPATVSQLITLNKDTTLVSIVAIQEVIRAGSSLTSITFGVEVQPAYLQVFIVIGLMFIAVNFALSRLSRRLEIRERQRTGTTLERVSGVEDQVAAEADVSGSR